MTPDRPIKLRLNIPESGRYQVVAYIENQDETPLKLTIGDQEIRGMALQNDGTAPTLNMVVFDQVELQNGTTPFELASEVEIDVKRVEVRRR